MFAQGARWSLPGRTILPIWTFLDTYVFKLGILDGYQGLLIAFMASYYVYEKYAKLGRPGQRDGDLNDHSSERKTLNILHIDTGVEMRGGQRQLLNLATALEARGHLQTIATPEESPVEKQFRKKGLTTFLLPGHDLGHLFGAALLRQHVREKGFDIVHAHDGARAIAGADGLGWNRHTARGHAARAVPAEETLDDMDEVRARQRRRDCGLRGRRRGRGSFRHFAPKGSSDL